MRTFIGQSRLRRRRGHLRAASLVVGAALLIAGCSSATTSSTSTTASTGARATTPPGSSALKPIDQAVLQATVDMTAQALLVPGAAVILRTPLGEFTVTYGTTMLGATASPRADTHFRIASNTKTMTAAVIVQLAQEGKLGLGDPISTYVPGVPNGDNNSFMGYDLTNQVTLVVWTNLAVSLDGLPTANALMVKLLDQIYVVSPVPPPPSSPAATP